MTAQPGFSAAPRWRLLPASLFDSIALQWDELNDASFNSPLTSAAFVRQLLIHFGTGDERIALLGSAEKLDAACVVRTDKLASAASFQPSQAPIGLWLQRRSKPHGLPPPSLESPMEPLRVQALVELMAQLGALTTLFHLTQLDSDLVARPPESERLITSDYIQTARITVTGTFDAYWAARGKNLRSNMKKQRSKLEAEGVGLRHSVVTSADEVAAAIADYGQLESAGWKAAGGTAVAAGNVQGRFYTALLEDHCRRGEGSIHRYFYGDRIAAMDLCVSHAGTMVILKTAFDETIKGSSPALLMRHEYLPAIFETRAFERVEFYGRVMEWHTRWTSEIRTLYHATAFRWAAAGRLYRWRLERQARARAESGSDSQASAVNETKQDESS